MWIFLVLFLTADPNVLDLGLTTKETETECNTERQTWENKLRDQEMDKSRPILHVTPCLYVPQPGPPQLR